MSVQSNIIAVPLFQRLAVTTVGSAGTPSTLDLDVPRFRSMLPSCLGITIIGLTEGVPAADFEWTVKLFSGFDRDHQQVTPIVICAAPAMFSATNPQGERCTEYATVENFLLDSRLQLSWQNKAGVNVVRSALISAVALVRVST